MQVKETSSVHVGALKHSNVCLTGLLQSNKITKFKSLKWHLFIWDKRICKYFFPFQEAQGVSYLAVKVHS